MNGARDMDIAFWSVAATGLTIAADNVQIALRWVWPGILHIAGHLHRGASCQRLAIDVDGVRVLASMAVKIRRFMAVSREASSYMMAKPGRIGKAVAKLVSR